METRWEGLSDLASEAGVPRWVVALEGSRCGWHERRTEYSSDPRNDSAQCVRKIEERELPVHVQAIGFIYLRVSSLAK